MTGGLPGPRPEVAIDEFDSFPDGAGGHVDQFEAVVQVGLPVEALEPDRLREADSAHRRRGDEPEQMNEEDPPLVDPRRDDTVNFRRQDGRCRQPEVVGQREGAHRRPVKDLDRRCRR